MLPDSRAAGRCGNRGRSPTHDRGRRRRQRQRRGTVSERRMHMSCYTIRQIPVVFEKVAYRPGHPGLLIDAFKELGFETDSESPEGKRSGLRIWLAGTIRTAENTVLYQDGMFEVPSTLLKKRLSLDRRPPVPQCPKRRHSRAPAWPAVFREYSPPDKRADIRISSVRQEVANGTSGRHNRVTDGPRRPVRAAVP
jgi:hypothetical protein